MQTHKVVLLPYKHGKAIIFYNGTKIGVSKEPIFYAARFLLRHGLASYEDTIETYRSETKCMSAKVGVAASKTVKEDRLGIRVVGYTPSQFLFPPPEEA